MAISTIEWTEMSWNPITGCTKVSSGCTNCYAEVMSRRLKAMGQYKYRNAFDVTLHEDVLSEPFKWKKPHNIFVCSMSDLFHEKVPFEFIDKVMNTIIATPYHKYQILTKRSKRMYEYFNNHPVPQNAWLGVTVEVAKSKERMNFLRQLPAKTKFLSCEPLLEDLGELNLDGIDWVIVGGESGSRARPMKEEWAVSIMNQAEKQKTPFFFKQWGAWGGDGVKRNKKSNGKLILGRVCQEMPKEYMEGVVIEIVEVDDLCT